MWGFHSAPLMFEKQCGETRKGLLLFGILKKGGISTRESKWKSLSEAEILLITSTETEPLEQKHPPAFSAKWIGVNQILQCLNVKRWCKYVDFSKESDEKYWYSLVYLLM